MNKPSRQDLAIIIVSFNTKALLLKTLESAYRAVKKSKLSAEIFVVDNASTDGSSEAVAKFYPDVNLLTNKTNRGYAHANNQAIKLSNSRYILLLNSDTLLSEKTISVMSEYMDQHPKVGVSTCRVLLSDGSLDPACHRGFPTPWAALTYFLGLEKLLPRAKIFSQYHLYHLPLDQIHEIDSPCGAFYLIRRSVVTQIGLLDETFFMYAEDLDWSYRVKSSGWKIIYNPQTYIIHLKKRSGRRSSDLSSKRRATVEFYETMKIFYQKHYEKRYPKILMLLVFVAIDLVKYVALKKL